MTRALATILLLGVTGLSAGCSTYIENEASLAFEPIYPSAHIAPEGEAPAERGKRVYAMYDEIQGSIHGTDHREQARQLELKARAEANYQRTLSAKSAPPPALLVGKSEPRGSP